MFVVPTHRSKENLPTESKRQTCTSAPIAVAAASSAEAFHYWSFSFLFQGLRIAAISGVLGTCIGAWVKCFSVSPDLFWVGFVGQSIVAASQVFILSLPAKVAAVWFGPDQVSSACSIGVFGNQVSGGHSAVLPRRIIATV